MQAKSLWYVGSKEVEVRSIEVPDPAPNEILVRTEACGVCTWDLFIFSGGFQPFAAFPFYFGHEGIGRVVKVGSHVTRWKEGDRLALREGPVGAPARGHMAELVIQPSEGPVAIPDDGIPATRWGIEPTACCVNAIDRAEIAPGQSVALVGCGFMGSIILQLLAASPAARVVVFDLRPESLAYARTLASRYPHIEVVDVSGVAEDSDAYDEEFDVAFETAAVESALRLADRSVRPGGTLVVFSWHHHTFEWDFGNWHMRGLTVINASPMASPDFDSCFRRSVPLISGGRISMDGLVTHVATPEEAQGLYEDGLSKDNGYIKGFIDWS